MRRSNPLGARPASARTATWTKPIFGGIGCGAPDAVSGKLCRSYGLAIEARNSARMRDKYDDFCRKAWEDFGPGGKVQPGLLKERKLPK
jgi:hypothetical protein